jgi:hypothetical protein
MASLAASRITSFGKVLVKEKEGRVRGAELEGARGRKGAQASALWFDRVSCLPCCGLVTSSPTSTAASWFCASQ